MSNKLVNGIRSLIQTSPATPAAGSRLLYPKSDGWYEKDDAGVERRVTSAPIAVTAPTGSYQSPPNIVTQAGAATVNGNQSWVPFDVGPQTCTYDRIAVNVGTALVAGTTPVVRLGIYADDGSGGRPGSVILDAGGLTSLTTTGIQFITISQTLAPGRYWLSAKYTYSVAPTTALQLFNVSTGSHAAPGLSPFSNIYHGYVLTGQSAGALGSASSAAASTANVVVIGMRRA